MLQIPGVRRSLRRNSFMLEVAPSTPQPKKDQDVSESNEAVNTWELLRKSLSVAVHCSNYSCFGTVQAAPGLDRASVCQFHGGSKLPP